MMAFLSTSSLLSLVVLYLTYEIGCVLYRLFFSPLSRFPGPKLAAATLWYECWHDVFRRGQYTFEIAKMHERYGPIVRISPYELHVNDPDFYDELYVQGSVRRTMKYLWAVRMFGRSTSTFGTPEHDLHRIRRSAVSPFFSKSSVQQLEPVVQLVVDKLISRLDTLQGSGSHVNLFDVFSALTGDVISQYAFAKPLGLMDSPDFAPHWHRAIMDISENGYWLMHFTWMEPLLRNMPLWLVRLVSPQTMPLIEMQRGLEEQINAFKEDLKEGRKPTGQRTVFYDMLANDQVRLQEKESVHLATEAQAIMGAGTMTTAHLLAILSFHLLDNPDVLNKMQADLNTIMLTRDAKPEWQQLEQLPYLNAVVKEGLRMSYGTTHRLQRISPDVALRYKEWTIPVGTPVGMTTMLLHNNPDNFPEPRNFDPERWLQPSAGNLGKYMVAFSKGSRQCAGMNLAYCEVYLTIAAVFAPGRFKLELYETTARDAEPAHDFFNAGYPDDSEGIRVVVRGERDNLR